MSDDPVPAALQIASLLEAEELGVVDLLARACVEAGLGPSGAP
jgi:hypothetical protein